MAFEVVVLGSSGTHPGAGRACSGYLLRADGADVLVDCGNGSTANLLKLTAPERLAAVLLTHRHADHCVDLIGMYYALAFHRDGPQAVDVYAPSDVADHLSVLVDSNTRFTDVCRFHDVAPGDHLEVGALAVDLFASDHPVPTVSVRAVVDGAVVAYSADSAGGTDLVECARGADLFLCEATWQGEPESHPPGVHLTARGAAAVARDAGVGRLVLTHLWPALHPERSLAEAASGFDGALSLAEDGQTWTVP